MKRIFLLLLSLVLLMILITAQADAPVLSLTSGLYEGSVTVEITAPGADAILYTLDGSIPTEENAQVYAGPLTFTESTALRVRTVKGGELGEIVSESYIIDTHTKLDIVAVIIDPAELWDDEKGLFAKGKNNILHLDPFDSNATFMKNTDSPRDAEASYIVRSTGEVVLNECIWMSTEKSGYGLTLPQKSFVIEAEDGMFEAPLFDGSRTMFTSLALDNGGVDGMFTRSASHAMMEMLHEHMDTDMLILQRSPVAVYLNGEYWGQYWLTETLDPLVICQHEGIDAAEAGPVRVEHSLNAVTTKGDYIVYDGKTYYMHMAYEAGPEVIRAYAEEHFDVDNLLDWFASKIFFGDLEPGLGDFYRLPGGKWRASATTFHTGLFVAGHDSPSAYTTGTMMTMYHNVTFAALMKVPEYRDAFLMKLGALWQKLPTMEMQWTLSGTVNLISDEMPYHFIRWAPEHIPLMNHEWPQESHAAMAYWQKRISRMSNLTMVARPFYVYYYTQRAFGLTDEEMLHYFGSPMPPEPYGFEGQ